MATAFDFIEEPPVKSRFDFVEEQNPESDLATGIDQTLKVLSLPVQVITNPAVGEASEMRREQRAAEPPSVKDRILNAIGQSAGEFVDATTINPEVVTAPITAPIVAYKALPKTVKEPVEKALGYAGNVVRAIPSDVAETVSGTEPYYELHNLAAAALNEPLPIDKLLAEASTDAPTWATIGKISEGIAGTIPMMAAFGRLPVPAQKLALAGFTAQMLAGVPETARALGEELGKPKEEQDPDKITSLVSQGIQEVGFGVMGTIGTKRAFTPEVTTPSLEK